MTTEEIIQKIHDAEKKDPAIAFVSGDLEGLDWGDLRFVGGADFGVLKGHLADILAALERNGEFLDDSEVELLARNSALPLADLSRFNARIEPGAIIREDALIHDGAVVMMGAVINIGAQVGKRTMIDMNAVLGGRATVGDNCHIGACAVLAGVIEPASAQPVVIEDDVLVGACAVVLEGVRVGKGSVVAAGSVVVSDVPPGSVVAGVPAKVVKQVDAQTSSKTALVDALRAL